MNILVCVKQVVDSSETLVLDEGAGCLSPTGATVFRMNRPDEYALEEALVLKERAGPCEVTALTVGPERATSVLRRALEMGADRAVHILLRGEDVPGPSRIARAVSAWASTRRVDLVITGVMSEDEMSGITGFLIGAFLGIPCVPCAVEIEPLAEACGLKVTCEIEGGIRPVYVTKPPAVLTIQTGINTPRYPTLTKVLRARSMKPETIPIEDLGLPDPSERVLACSRPQDKPKGVFLEGSARDKARSLARILRDRSFLP